MQAMKSSFVMAAVVVVALMIALAGTATAQQNCSTELGGLMQCAPYVVPGANNGPPSAQCCAALSAVNRNCLCATLNIISRLPGTCKLPQLSCSA